jgi:hypothetical protein
MLLSIQFLHFPPLLIRIRLVRLLILLDQEPSPENSQYPSYEHLKALVRFKTIPLYSLRN